MRGLIVTKGKKLNKLPSTVDYYAGHRDIIGGVEEYAFAQP